MDASPGLSRSANALNAAPNEKRLPLPSTGQSRCGSNDRSQWGRPNSIPLPSLDVPALVMYLEKLCHAPNHLPTPHQASSYPRVRVPLCSLLPALEALAARLGSDCRCQRTPDYPPADEMNLGDIMGRFSLALEAANLSDIRDTQHLSITHVRTYAQSFFRNRSATEDVRRCSLFNQRRSVDDVRAVLSV